MALASASILFLQGTKQRAHFLAAEEPVFSEDVSGFKVYHWPAKDDLLTNSSTGVTVAIKKQFVHPKFHTEVLSPDPCLQGRGGAIRCYKTYTFDLLKMSLYFPASGSLS